MWDAARIDDEEMVGYVRRRAIVAAVLAGAVALVGLFALRADSPYLWGGLTTRGLPLVVVSVVLGTASLVLVVRRHDRVARVSAIGAVASIVVAWGVAQ